jgi:hypothetical protein
MTDEELDELGDVVRAHIGKLRNPPLAFAVMVMPNDANHDPMEPRILAAIGTLQQSEKHRRSLIEGMFILAEQLDERYPDSKRLVVRN